MTKETMIVNVAISAASGNGTRLALAVTQLAKEVGADLAEITRQFDALAQVLGEKK